MRNSVGFIFDMRQNRENYHCALNLAALQLTYSAVRRLIIQGRTSITGGEQMKISFCGHEPIWYFFSLITQNSNSSKLTHHFEMYESILFCCFLNCSNLTKHATYYTGVFSYFRLGGNWFTSARVYLNDSIYKKKLFVLKCKKCL